MTITWGGIQFTGPHFLSSCNMPDSSGLYAIMVKKDPTNKPSNYTIVYFGQTSNFEERVSTSHHKYDCWQEQTGSDNEIFYGLNVMPNSTDEEREELESQLIKKYNPICND